MPELPEVETIRRQLHARLAGRVVRDVQMLRTGREFPAAAQFVQAVRDRMIVAVERRAKVLLWRFADGGAMIGHLKMTGKFLFVDDGYAPQKHDRMLFFTDGPTMLWSDVRQFGYVKLLSDYELEHMLASYGPEPLATDAEILAARLTLPKTRRVKTALLDQATIAGVGNIYADEACHRAGIRPMRRLSTLRAADRLRLAKEIQTVLAESLAQNGTSANDYVDTEGVRGGFLSLLRVYGRQGNACARCAGIIKKTVLGGRGTHYCPGCQK